MSAATADIPRTTGHSERMSRRVHPAQDSFPLRLRRNSWGTIPEAAIGLFLLLALPLRASAQWQPMIPSLQCGGDSSLYAIDVSGSLELCVGEDGAAYRSTDGGASFLPMIWESRMDLYDARTGPAGITLAAGDSGMIARSSDGGASWDPAHLTGYSTRAFYSLAWSDAVTAFAAGGASAIAHGSAALPDGVIVRSRDAGRSWESIRTDPALFFWRLAVLGPATPAPELCAAAYGPLSQGLILTSTDRGDSWRSEITLPFLPHDLATVDTRAGAWLVAAGGDPFDFGRGPRFAIRRPGAAWTILPDTFTVRGFAWSIAAGIDSAFTGSADIPILYSGLHDGTLLRSLDGGASWHAWERPIRCPVYDLNVNGVPPRGMLLAGSGRALQVRGTPSTNTGDTDPDILFYLGAPFPLPARGGFVQIPYRSPAAALLECTDVLGRRVDARALDRAEAGTWRPELAGAPPGIYFVQLTSSGFLAIRRFVK